MTDTVVRLERPEPSEERITQEKQLYPGLMLEEVTVDSHVSSATPTIRSIMVLALRYNFAWFDKGEASERFVVETDDERTFVGAVRVGNAAVAEVIYLEDVGIASAGQEMIGDDRDTEALRYLRIPKQAIEAAA